MINPFAKYRMSNGWSDAHPAWDFATPIGFEFRSPADGVYLRRPSELARIPGYAGVYGDLLLPGGYRIRFAHMQRHIAAHGSTVEEGRTILGATGNTGWVDPLPTPQEPWLGAHIHTTGFKPDGTRWKWLLDVGGGGSPAGGEQQGDNDVNDRQNMMLEVLYQELTAGQAGVKTQGGTHKILTDTLSAARSANSQATAAHKAIGAHAADWVQGEAGVRNAGRLLNLLARASTSGTAQVDEKALAAELGPLLADAVGALSDADVARVAARCADVLASRLKA